VDIAPLPAELGGWMDGTSTLRANGRSIFSDIKNFPANALRKTPKKYTSIGNGPKDLQGYLLMSLQRKFKTFLPRVPSTSSMTSASSNWWLWNVYDIFYVRYNIEQIKTQAKGEQKKREKRETKTNRKYFAFRGENFLKTVAVW
jgi:hypothetical protein